MLRHRRPTIQIRLALDAEAIAHARALTAEYIRTFYFDDESLDPGDQAILDDFSLCFQPPRALVVEHGSCWVAYVGSTPVGSVLTERRHGRTRISRLYVRPGYRTLGIGKELLAAAVRHCEIVGVTPFAMIPTQQLDAVRLFTGAGFVRTGRVLGGCVETVGPSPRLDPENMQAGPQARIVRRHVDSLISQIETLLEQADTATSDSATDHLAAPPIQPYSAAPDLPEDPETPIPGSPRSGYSWSLPSQPWHPGQDGADASLAGSAPNLAEQAAEFEISDTWADETGGEDGDDDSLSFRDRSDPSDFI